jgi:hypothetical protein
MTAIIVLSLIAVFVLILLVKPYVAEFASNEIEIKAFTGAAMVLSVVAVVLANLLAH